MEWASVQFAIPFAQLAPRSAVPDHPHLYVPGVESTIVTMSILFTEFCAHNSDILGRKLTHSARPTRNKYAVQ